MNIYTYKDISQLQKHIPKNSGIFVIIDNKVKDYFSSMKNWNFIPIKADEKNKSLETAGRICSRLMAMKADRDCFIIGAGGGVTTDLAGFVASVYKRGVKFGLVPTTLLAAADAAIGGKNGVNLSGVKNMVGTITQPEWTYQSTCFFRTLDNRVFREGEVEMLKTFLLFDRDCFISASNFFTAYDHKDPSPRQEQTLRKLMKRCATLKAEVVKKDESDHGCRRMLNLGHTFGHALESYFAQSRKNVTILHGEAVLAGMLAAARLSVRLGVMKEEDFEAVYEGLAKTRIPLVLGIDADKTLKFIYNDKKVSNGKLHLILPVEIGRATSMDIPMADFERLCKDLVL